jgi:hypothetical protein
MYTHHPIRVHRTTSGLKIVVMPRPALAGFHLVNGTLSSVKKPSYWLESKTGYNYYSTLLGLNVEDFDRIQPDQVFYELGDGSYLMATAAACLKSSRTEHRATSTYKPCFEHQIADLVIAELPEVEEVPIFDFSDL